MVTTDIKNACSVNDYDEFSHSRFITVTPSRDEYMNADATNLNDPSNTNSDNNNRARNVLFQQKFNTINKKLCTIKSGGLTGEHNQHDRKLLSRVYIYNIVSKTWIALPDLSIFNGRIVTTRRNIGSSVFDSENQKQKQDLRELASIVKWLLFLGNHITLYATVCLRQLVKL